VEAPKGPKGSSAVSRVAAGVAYRFPLVPLGAGDRGAVETLCEGTDSFFDEARDSRTNVISTSCNYQAIMSYLKLATLTPSTHSPFRENATARLDFTSTKTLAQGENAATYRPMANFHRRGPY
jgi:hypothetical protein